MDLRQLRTELGLKLHEAAAGMGIPKGTLSKIEQHKLIPGGDLLLRISSWAEGERKRRRLPATSKLDWSYLDELRRERAADKARRKGAAAEQGAA